MENNISQVISEPHEGSKPQITGKIIKDQKDRYNRLLTILIYFVLILGFVLGVLYISFGKEIEFDFVNDWFDMTIQQKSELNFLYLFLTNWASTILYVIAIFFLGFSPISSPLIGLVAFLKGLGLGLNITYVYISYGWRGLVYEATINIPINIVLIWAIILATREGIKFSSDIAQAMKNKNDKKIDTKQYIIKFIVISLITIFTVLLQTILDLIFFRYFNIL